MLTTPLKLQQTLLVIALAAVYPVQASAAVSAGVAQFIAGDVNVRRPDGKVDPLLKGKDIESGQAIVTGPNGRAQVKFSDGGLISLQPNTEFKIANYVDQADPKQDRFLVDLLRGSMRAITGLIGKRNRENYKVTTTTATIGIRGSGFNAGYNPDGSLGVTTEFDAIEVCNAGGCVGLTAGESVRVNNSTDAPVRTNVKAPVPTPDTVQDAIVAGNQTNSDGKSSLIVAPDSTSKIKTFTDLWVSAVATPASNNPSNQIAAGTVVTSTFDGNNMTKVVNPASGGTTWGPTSAAVSFGSLGNVSDANFIGWGTWTSASSNFNSGATVTALDYFHYVAGRPTPASLMPGTGTATYNFAGGTTPVKNNNGTISFGTLTAASTNMTVNFGTGNVGINIVTSFGGTTYVSGSISAGSSKFSSTGGLAVNGFFVGTDAGRAGLTYINTITAGITVTGAVAFMK